MSKTKKTNVGTVIGHKMDKTAVVEVVRRVQHPVFTKFFYKRKKFKVHDPKKECALGDRVLITETIPISKTKRWALSKIIEKAVL